MCASHLLLNTLDLYHNIRFTKAAAKHRPTATPLCSPDDITSVVTDEHAHEQLRQNDRVEDDPELLSRILIGEDERNESRSN